MTTKWATDQSAIRTNFHAQFRQLPYYHGDDKYFHLRRGKLGDFYRQESPFKGRLRHFCGRYKTLSLMFTLNGIFLRVTVSFKLLRCDYVSCRSRMTESTAKTTTFDTLAFYQSWYLVFKTHDFAYRVTNFGVPPLALLTNGLSLIIFARMYRAKQQVINRNMQRRH